MINGGGAGRRTRPMTKPAPTSAIVINTTGTKRSLRSRRAQALQNLRLVQKCHLKRSSFVPHSEQKFGLYTVRAPIRIALRLCRRKPQSVAEESRVAFLCANSAFFAVKTYTAKGAKNSQSPQRRSARRFRKQLKCCLVRPKVTIVGLIVRLLVDT